MKISVIIPCRNEAKFIEQTLNSLINQTGISDNYEIIVVDGISEDGTQEIIKKYIDRFPNIRLISNPDKITPIALNLGIKSSVGEYVCILGAHSVYSENYLYECLNLFSKHPEVSCIGGPIISKGKDNFSSAVALVMSSMIGVGNAKHRFPNYEGYAEMACFPMFNRHVFDKIGLYDESLIKNQDDDLCFRLRKEGEKIFISPQVKATYYVRNSPKSLFRQYFSYGLWRVATAKKHKATTSFRQITPSLFLLGVILLFILGWIFRSHLLMIILPGIYISILIGFLIKILLKNKIMVAIYIPFVVIILHFSYGIGFLAGLYKFWKK